MALDSVEAVMPVDCKRAFKAMRRAITVLPAADVAPVVRCKDCRYFGAAQTYLCNMHHRAANVEDYCSYGIRMDGGEHHAD